MAARLLASTSCSSCSSRFFPASAEPPPLQLTLALLKPDLIAHPSAHVVVRDTLLANGFRICRGKPVLWSLDDAEAFYAEHRGRFFFRRLTGYMSSGPFAALVLAKPGAIAHWRALIGQTRPVRARLEDPNRTLRAQFGITDTRNSLHGSDTGETAAREIGFFFPVLRVSDLLRELSNTSPSGWVGPGEDFPWSNLGFDD